MTIDYAKNSNKPFTKSHIFHIFLDKTDERYLRLCYEYFKVIAAKQILLRLCCKSKSF